MELSEVIKYIDSLKENVQQHTNSYFMDSEYVTIIDSQLNGYIKTIIIYCQAHNLKTIEHELKELLPIETNAIEFFAFWEGISSLILEYSNFLEGQNRVRVINEIACTLQKNMTKTSIDAYLGGFGVVNLDNSFVVKSNRIYVEQTLRNVDGIIVLNIAKNLNLLSLDLIEIDIPNKASTEFVTQQINKCKTKISQADYDGAITNARTLIEEILINIETNIIGERQKYDGDLPKLYKRIAKLINLYPDKDVENSLNEILRGFISVINGFSGISNSIADRHATSKHPKLHHAKIAVNSSMIICEFILESYEYQQSKTYNPLNPSAQTTNR